MSEAPERIWAITEPNDISADILGAVYSQQIPNGMNGTPVEYIRADRIEALTAERDDLKAKLDKAVETLEFYGDERNYESEYIPDECGCCGSWYEPKIHKDGQDSGDKARATLAEITGGKP